VPKFHKCIKKWCEANTGMKKPLPWLELRQDDPMVKFGQRIPMRAGSVLVWDQTMFHGTSPNISCECRMAQFLKALPRECVSEERLIRRAEALKNILIKNLGKVGEGKGEGEGEGEGEETVVGERGRELKSFITPTGLQVFGLDVIEKQWPN
jgi:hypothetical protein